MLCHQVRHRLCPQDPPSQLELANHQVKVHRGVGLQAGHCVQRFLSFIEQHVLSRVSLKVWKSKWRTCIRPMTVGAAFVLLAGMNLTCCLACMTSFARPAWSGIFPEMVGMSC